MASTRPPRHGRRKKPKKEQPSLGPSPYAVITGYDERNDPYARSEDEHGLESIVTAERQEQILHWFNTSHDQAQRRILEELLSQCSQPQLSFCRHLLGSKLFVEQDFTRALPRSLSLRVFQFLDPRSVCRAGQVCWYWRELTQDESIWQQKCLMHNWFLPYTPSPFERGVWKAHYIRCVDAVRGKGDRSVLEPSVQRQAADVQQQHSSLSKWGTYRSTMQETQHMPLPDYHTGHFGPTMQSYDRLPSSVGAPSTHGGTSVYSMGSKVDDYYAPSEDGSASVDRISNYQDEREPWRSGPFRTTSMYNEQSKPRDAWSKTLMNTSKRQTKPSMLDSGVGKTKARKVKGTIKYMSDAVPLSTDVTIKREYREHKTNIPSVSGEYELQRASEQAHDYDRLQQSTAFDTLSRTVPGAARVFLKDEPTKEDREQLVRAPLAKKLHAFDAAVPELVSDDRYPRVVCVSSEAPARHLLLSSCRFDVITVAYDYEGTSNAILFNRIARVLRGRKARSIAFVADGGPGQMRLTQNDDTVTCKSLKTRDGRKFWKQLGELIISEDSGGRIDLFVGHLSESGSGLDLLTALESCAGVRAFASDDVVGAPQDLDWVVQGKNAPTYMVARLYFNEKKLNAWRCIAEAMGETVQVATVALAPLVRKFQVETTSTLSGEILESVLGTGNTELVVQAAPLVTEALTYLQKSDEVVDVAKGLKMFFSQRVEPRVEKKGRRRGDDSDDSDDDDDDELAGTQEGFFAWPVVEWSQPEDLGNSQLRENLVAELVRTETRYVNALKCVKDLYVTPIRVLLKRLEETEMDSASHTKGRRAKNTKTARDNDVAKPKALISRASYRTIFDNIRRLLAPHEKMLEELRSRALTWSDSRTVGELFTSRKDHFKLYSTYASNLEAALHTLEACLSQSWGFRAFACQARHHPLSINRSLSDLLREPVKRISEYYTLLYRLKSLTPKDHSDYLDLCGSCEIFMKIDRRIRKFSTNAVRAEEAAVIEKSIDNAPSLFDGNREFIVSEEFVQLEAFWVDDTDDDKDNDTEESWRTGTSRKRQRLFRPTQDVGLFLFSDSLVVTTKVEHQSAFGRTFSVRDVFESRIPLSTMMVQPVMDCKEYDGVFQIKTPQEQWYFKSPTTKRCKEWVEQMVEIMKAHDEDLM